MRSAPYVEFNMEGDEDFISTYESLVPDVLSSISLNGLLVKFSSGSELKAEIYLFACLGDSSLSQENRSDGNSFDSMLSSL